VVETTAPRHDPAIVSDDELERHVETSRSDRPRGVPTLGSKGGTVEERVDELQAAARETHTELARRIRNVDDASAETARVDRLADRMTAIEERLATIEEQLAE
jgi:seryl-tRNA synthetase